jgi:hypothetical protein
MSLVVERGEKLADTGSYIRGECWFCERGLRDLCGGEKRRGGLGLRVGEERAETSGLWGRGRLEDVT